jgi:hypothetical protein
MADRTTTNTPGETREQAPQSQSQNNRDLRAETFTNIGPENQSSAERRPLTAKSFGEKWRQNRQFLDSGARILIKVLEGTNAA